MSEPESLNNPPIGATVRQDKPWESLGISRATYYRNGKQKPRKREPLKKLAADIAKITQGRYSLRSLQRDRFVQRYGIPELSKLISGDLLLSNGMVENVAKWPHAEQQCFVEMLSGWLQRSPKMNTIDPKTAESLGSIQTLLFEVGRDEARKQARAIYAMCLAINDLSPEEFDLWIAANSAEGAAR
jgi:hypothetical protein